MKFCPSSRAPSSASSERGLPVMDVLASAAVLEAVDISTESSGGMAAGAAGGNVEHADML